MYMYNILYMYVLPTSICVYVSGMCLEKRAFFRIISGMHSSINIHLSALYLVSGIYM